MEATIFRSYVRGANFRRWLRRPDCPAIMQECRKLFDLAFAPKERFGSDGHHTKGDSLPFVNAPADLATKVEGKIRLHANFRHNGVVFSRSATHVGNSLISYYPRTGHSSACSVVGSIKYIFTNHGEIKYAVQRQQLLPAGSPDPFRRYRHFPASLYSSKMEDDLDIVPPNSVICHVARLELPSDSSRAVILKLGMVRTVMS